MSHERFHYKSLAEVKEKASELGVSLPFAEDTTILAQPLKVRDITFPNRLGIAPMKAPIPHRQVRRLIIRFAVMSMKQLAEVR